MLCYGVVTLRRWDAMVVAGVVGAALAGARTALARDAASDCSPGDWFCDDESGDASAPEPELPPAAPEQTPNAPRASPSAPAADPTPPGSPSVESQLTTGPLEQREEESPAPWSANLRLLGVALGSGHGNRETGLGGVGISLRYALWPSVALDLGLDAFRGTDYNGYHRGETSLSVSALGYLNPGREIRSYVLGGLHASAARVQVAGNDQDWAYVGVHAGLGIEFAISERVALNVDLLGFLRGRTDSRAEREPEFSDGSGNLTNTSGGGVFRGGISFYW